MGYVGIALGIIIAIVVVILLLKFVRFLFTGVLVSRILSIGTGIAALVMAFKIANGAQETFTACAIASTILTSLSWLFCIGPVVFDVEWDGTFNYDVGQSKLEPNMIGGFLFNAFIALLISGGAYAIFGTDSPVVFFLLPIALLFINAIFVIRMLRNSF